MFLAQDIKTGRRVALKVSRQLLGPEGSERFRREAELLAAALVHPNIVAVYDRGETEDGFQYLVLPWLEGESLRSRLQREGVLAWEDAARIAAQIADALAYAHDRGIIHRDVKPENVILESGAAMLTDFGAFGQVGVDSHDAYTTQGAAFIGTPVYMAPEQLAGRRQDARTDLYALGIVLFEMLFGEPPFGGSAREVFSRALVNAITIPADPRIPDALRALLSEMLRHNPAERPRSARDVAERLQSLVRVRGRHTAVLRPPNVRAVEARGAAAEATALGAGTVSTRAWAGVFAMTLIVMVAALWFAFHVAASSDPPRRPDSGVVSRPPVPSQQRPGVLLGILQGLTLVALGFGGGAVTTRVLAKRKSVLEGAAGRLLLGTKSRRELTDTIAQQIDELVEQSKEIDARVLGATIVQMLREFDDAKESNDRQSALMRAVELLEKLRARLSPWYVQHSKLIAVTPTAVGTVAGCAKIVAEVQTILKAW